MLTIFNSKFIVTFIYYTQATQKLKVNEHDTYENSNQVSYHLFNIVSSLYLIFFARSWLVIKCRIALEGLVRHKHNAINLLCNICHHTYCLWDHWWYFHIQAIEKLKVKEHNSYKIWIRFLVHIIVFWTSWKYR